MPHVRLVHRPPRERAEQRPARDAPPAANLEPAADERDRARVDADHPPPAALAALHHQRPRLRVEVLRLQRQRLADAKSAAPQHRHQRPVAHPGWRPPRAAPHEQLDLRACQQVSVQPRTVPSSHSRALLGSPRHAVRPRQRKMPAGGRVRFPRTAGLTPPKRREVSDAPGSDDGAVD